MAPTAEPLPLCHPEPKGKDLRTQKAYTTEKQLVSTGNVQRSFDSALRASLRMTKEGRERTRSVAIKLVILSERSEWKDLGTQKAYATEKRLVYASCVQRFDLGLRPTQRQMRHWRICLPLRASPLRGSGWQRGHGEIGVMRDALRLCRAVLQGRKRPRDGAAPYAARPPGKRLCYKRIPARGAGMRRRSI